MLFALGLATLLTVPAWAAFELMGLAPSARVAATVVVFLAKLVGLTLYIQWCIKRNCALRRAITARQRRSALTAATR